MITVRGIKTILRELSEEDAEDVVKLRNDPANNKFLFQKPITVDDQVSWIRKNKKTEDAKNFKITNLDNEFKGTISIYNISNKQGEFGRYIATNPVNAIEAEYLLLKVCFEQLGLNAVYCQTNFENKAVWSQHLKLGFKEKGKKDVTVGTAGDITVQAVVQEITAEEFRNFNYDKIIKLIKFF
jgi:RimJ/RimL family protein N-acetyltransferase